MHQTPYIVINKTSFGDGTGKRRIRPVVIV